MTIDDGFDRLLESTLVARGTHVVPAGLEANVIERVHDTRQRRPRFRGLDPRAWPASRRSLANPANRGAMGFLVAAVLSMLLIAAAAIVAGRLLDARVPLELVYGDRSGGLYLLALDGAEPRRIADEGRYVEPRFSPDRRWIAADLIPTGSSGIDAVGPSRRLVVLAMDGTKALDVTSMNPVWEYTWGVSGPSAGWLAAAVDDAVVVIDPASRRRASVPIPAGSARAIAWSPDQPMLWWVTGQPRAFEGIDSVQVHTARVTMSATALELEETRSFVVQLDPARKYRGLERMAVSPDGRTLAFRARTEGWLRSDVVLVDVDGGAPTYLNPRPPDAPWAGPYSGIRWTPNGQGVLVELAEQVDDDPAIVRPAILPIDGSAPRAIEAGRITADSFGGVVRGDGPVLPTDTTLLVGGAQEYIEVSGGQVARYDLWLADADGLGSRLIATDTLGGDVR